MSNVLTPAFRDWFGNSKVVDADGKPLVVYHGTNNQFSEFGPSEAGDFGAGSYFTRDSSYAIGFGKKVMSVFLSLQNPFVYQAPRRGTVAHDFARAILSPVDACDAIMRQSGEPVVGDEVTVALERRGFDGVIAAYPDGTTDYIAFRPEQIKCAVRNSGRYDPASPSILD